MTELVEVSTDENPVLDVVFVHGLDGDARNSWMGKARDSFWPKWLAQDVPGAAVWSLGYDAASSGWLGHAMPIQDRAINLLAQLENHGIGQRPLCFVTHSMGGLVVKEMLLHAAEGRAGYADFATATCGVVFLATPHIGSDLVASAVVKALGVVYRKTPAVGALERNSAHLRQLNDRYRDWATQLGVHVEHRVFFETRPTRGVRVVDEGSANPGLPGHRPIPVDADHIDICKPADRRSLVYGQVKRFIAGMLTAQVHRPAPVEAAPDDLVTHDVGPAEAENVRTRTQLTGAPVGEQAAALPSGPAAWPRESHGPTWNEQNPTSHSSEQRGGQPRRRALTVGGVIVLLIGGGAIWWSSQTAGTTPTSPSGSVSLPPPAHPSPEASASSSAAVPAANGCTGALCVTTSWPMLRGCDGATGVAMASDGPDFATFADKPDLRKDAANAAGGASWKEGHLHLLLSGVDERPTIIQEIRKNKVEPLAAGPKWIYTPQGGCGDTYERVFTFDIDKGTVADSGVVGDPGAATSTLTPKPEALGRSFFVTKTEAADVRIDALSCAGNYKWSLDVVYVRPGEPEKTYTVGPFLSMGKPDRTSFYTDSAGPGSPPQLTSSAPKDAVCR